MVIGNSILKVQDKEEVRLTLYKLPGALLCVTL